MDYFDERSFYDSKTPSWGKHLAWCAVGLLAMLLLLWPTKGHSEHKARVGDVVTGHVVLCETLPDAAMLFSKLKEGGTALVKAWIDEPDNSCSLGIYTFVVGPLTGLGVRAENKDWVIFNTHPEGIDVNNFGVAWRDQFD